jgi:hypothetical protein
MQSQRASCVWLSDSYNTLTQEKWLFQAFSHAERLSLAKNYCDFAISDTVTRTFGCRYTCHVSKAMQGLAQQIGTHRTSLKRTSYGT